MKFLSIEAAEDVKHARPLRLEHGSGGFIREGYYGVDALEMPVVAIQADLNLPLSLLPDDSVGEIVSHHCFEHVANYLGLMRELHRVSQQPIHESASHTEIRTLPGADEGRR